MSDTDEPIEDGWQHLNESVGAGNLLEPKAAFFLGAEFAISSLMGGLNDQNISPEYRKYLVRLHRECLGFVDDLLGGKKPS